MLTRWWRRLQPRERRLLGAGGALAALLLLYALVWLPLTRQVERLRADVTAQRDELAWLREAAVRLGRHDLRIAAPTPADGASLPTLVDRSARTVGLARALRQLEPQRNGEAVSVRLEQVGFDEMLRWLEVLAREHGIEVETASIDPREAAGRVDAQLLLGLPARRPGGGARGPAADAGLAAARSGR